jgi:hypothetical protein
MEDAHKLGRAFTMFDLSARRKLDEYSISAEGDVRFQKKLSGSDDVETVQLRCARVSYATSWLQVNAGRFDLYPFVTSSQFFGALPVMGIHRVDGILAVSSFFFRMGMDETRAKVASPFAVAVFYTPSLFSATWSDLDQTQSFVLGQARLKAGNSDTQAVIRANVSKTRSDYFEYSPLSSQPSYSLSGEITFHRDLSLTADYGIQNIKHSSETGALACGIRFERIVTKGVFSLDDAGFEVQLPLPGSSLNPFTGGNAFDPASAILPQKAYYGRVKARIGAAFMEVHATTNRDDYTFGRVDPAALWFPAGAGFGPGRETDVSGLPLKSATGKNPAWLVNVGVVF